VLPVNYAPRMISSEKTGTNFRITRGCSGFYRIDEALVMYRRATPDNRQVGPAVT
jgi:hypothetical protein